MIFVGGGGIVTGAIVGDGTEGADTGAAAGGGGTDGADMGAVAGNIEAEDADLALVHRGVILISCSIVVESLGNEIVTAASAFWAVLVFSAWKVMVTTHPERSARSFFVKVKRERVPRADDIPVSAVSVLFITDMRQFDADSVAENVSAFVDDQVKVYVAAFAVTDAALFTVRLALGSGRAELAGRFAVEDGPALIGGG